MEVDKKLQFFLDLKLYSIILFSLQLQSPLWVWTPALESSPLTAGSIRASAPEAPEWNTPDHGDHGGAALQHGSEAEDMHRVCCWLGGNLMLHSVSWLQSSHKYSFLVLPSNVRDIASTQWKYAIMNTTECQKLNFYPEDLGLIPSTQRCSWWVSGNFLKMNLSLRYIIELWNT